VNRLRSILTKFGRNTNSNSKQLKRPAVLNKINKVTISKDSTYDLIGPPDKISNLRQFRYFVPKDESKLEYDYRMLRERVYEYNNDYWTQQNLKFLDAKRIYAQQFKVRQNYMNQMMKTSGNQSTHKPDQNDSDLQMNEFYKQFLNENYYNHYEYNKTWFKLNFQLLWMAARVNLYRLSKNNRFLSQTVKN
jgi:hypothetical protein